MEQEKRAVRCIVCPLSCLGEVTIEKGEITIIKNMTCRRGELYAREEVVAPRRMLTTTVRIIGGELPLLPVVSEGVLPKDKVLACARHLADIVVHAPIKEGDVVCRDILGLGVNIVASRSMAGADIE
ncbi:MAG: DUF1667 domain-containing protein [Dethiobacter sp.]|nr:DUF1667 domain-containing protein [Dethiobacter sp.]MBS4053835.1 DUF1667 domain-containing protein [Thermaerobacter sp.]